MLALGLFAITVLAALTASKEDGSAEPTVPVARPPAPPTQTLAFAQPAPAKPPVRRVRTGARVVVRVSSTVAGQTELEGLGLIEPVEPGVPASFDVLATRPGRYVVALLPVEGSRAVLGTLVVG